MKYRRSKLIIYFLGVSLGYYLLRLTVKFFNFFGWFAAKG